MGVEKSPLKVPARQELRCESSSIARMRGSAIEDVEESLSRIFFDSAEKREKDGRRRRIAVVSLIRRWGREKESGKEDVVESRSRVFLDSEKGRER